MPVVNKIKFWCKEIYRYLTANNYVAVYPDIKAKKHRVNQFEYHPDRFYKDICYNNAGYNLGDFLSFVIVDWMLARRGLKADQEVKRTCFLNTVGSNTFSSYQNAVIWGSGVGAKDELNSKINRILNKYPFRRLDIRAVRGPIAREKLIQFGHKCPAVYGDPAILMPLIYNPVPPEQKSDILIIPQFMAEKEIREKYPQYPIESMNTNDYKHVIDAIVSCKKVVTSSLHGIILAEAYGVPAVYFKTLEKTLKYEDYYASTGRNNVHLSQTLEEALTQIPPEIPDLSGLQQGLIDSFPYDLWE